MIIPKKYGGLEFSAYAHSCVLAKIASRSTTASSTVAVPNSLGPAELLHHYGTEEQKNYYLPRLARGEEVPVLRAHRPACGLRCRARFPIPASCAAAAGRGARCSGCASTSPSATSRSRRWPRSLDLRFACSIRSKLLGEKIDLGITCALIPRDTPGVTHRAAPLPAQHSVPERPHPGQGCVRAAGCHHRRREDGRQRLAHAGRAALGRALHLAALQRHRRREGGRVGDRRLCAHPHASSTCRWASSRVSRR